MCLYVRSGDSNHRIDGWRCGFAFGAAVKQFYENKEIHRTGVPPDMRPSPPSNINRTKYRYLFDQVNNAATTTASSHIMI